MTVPEPAWFSAASTAKTLAREISFGVSLLGL
jgi:hypothetical protein